jgi:hypothetical protein
MRKYHKHYMENARRRMHRGAPSMSRPGEEEFMTHAGSEYYTEGGHRYRRGPYGQMARANPEQEVSGFFEIVVPERMGNPIRNQTGRLSETEAARLIREGAGAYMSVVLPDGNRTALPKNPIEAYLLGVRVGLEQGYQACPILDDSWARKMLTGKKRRQAITKFQKDYAELQDQIARERENMQKQMLDVADQLFGTTLPDETEEDRRKRLRRLARNS